MYGHDPDIGSYIQYCTISVFEQRKKMKEIFFLGIRTKCPDLEEREYIQVGPETQHFLQYVFETVLHFLRRRR